VTLWIVSLISITLGLGVGALIRGILDSQKILQAELRAERAERKNDTDIAAAIIQSTEAGAKICTRAPYHEGPCNGVPSATCPAWPTAIASMPASPPRFVAKNLERFGGAAEIHSDDLELMFLDQLLIRFFHTLLKPEPYHLAVQVGVTPWNAFVESNPWAKEMPLLFELGWGYKLNEFQLNRGIRAENFEDADGGQHATNLPDVQNTRTELLRTL
jgi:hypothetical protein